MKWFSLAEVHPELVSSGRKKNKIKPDRSLVGSHKKARFGDGERTRVEAAVKSRTINKTGCPVIVPMIKYW